MKKTLGMLSIVFLFVGTMLPAVNHFVLPPAPFWGPVTLPVPAQPVQTSYCFEWPHIKTGELCVAVEGSFSTMPYEEIDICGRALAAFEHIPETAFGDCLESQMQFRKQRQAQKKAAREQAEAHKFKQRMSQLAEKYTAPIILFPTQEELLTSYINRMQKVLKNFESIADENILISLEEDCYRIENPKIFYKRPLWQFNDWTIQRYFLAVQIDQNIQGIDALIPLSDMTPFDIAEAHGDIEFLGYLIQKKVQIFGEARMLNFVKNMLESRDPMSADVLLYMNIHEYSVPKNNFMVYLAYVAKNQYPEAVLKKATFLIARSAVALDLLEAYQIAETGYSPGGFALAEFLLPHLTWFQRAFRI